MLPKESNKYITILKFQDLSILQPMPPPHILEPSQSYPPPTREDTEPEGSVVSEGSPVPGASLFIIPFTK